MLRTRTTPLVEERRPTLALLLPTHAYVIVDWVLGSKGLVQWCVSQQPLCLAHELRLLANVLVQIV